MSHNSSNESSNLFDYDGSESLEKITFSFNEQGRERSWCTSDNSSCCSLCRLPDDDVHMASDTSGMDDLQSMEALNDLVFSGGLVSTSAAAARPMLAASDAAIHSSSSMYAASSILTHHPFNSCQAHTCSVNNSMMMPPLSGRCISCQTQRTLNLPGEANFMTQFASKHSSFLSHEEKLSLQSLLFSASVPQQTDFLTAGFLSEGPLYAILSFLDVTSLVNLRTINTKLRSLASDNSAGWKNHCINLWSGKVRVCSEARRLLDSACTPADDQADETTDSDAGRSAAMKAYKASILEAKSNCELSEGDLCFDLARELSGVEWSFRFKESAGVDWTSWDPWWNNSTARKLVFMRNGSILQSYPPGRSPVVATHNNTPLYDVFSERMVQRNGVEQIPPRIEMRWRFVRSCMDLPTRPDGAYVRITVGGRDVPTYVVRRSPNGNWGFIMESCWGLYASFELGPKNGYKISASATNVTVRRALRRTRNGSRWVNIEDDDDEGNPDVDNENIRNVRRRPNPNPNMLVEDRAMTVSGVSQWREALLYNIGAVTLPEGNNVHQFDAAWQNALLLR